MPAALRTRSDWSPRVHLTFRVENVWDLHMLPFFSYKTFASLVLAGLLEVEFSSELIQVHAQPGFFLQIPSTHSTESAPQSVVDVAALILIYHSFQFCVPYWITSAVIQYLPRLVQSLRSSRPVQ